MNENKNYNDKNKMYDIMNTTQSNYSNMLKRLQIRKSFSNFVITYYSITLIVYTLTAEFFPDKFNTELSNYFNIILSIVVLTYSLIITNAKYSERIQAAERVLNEVKAKKRELIEGNVAEKRKEYENIMSKAEYRSEIDFFRTLKQKCKKNDVCWLRYKKGLEKMEDRDEADKLKEYLSENFPLTQQLKIFLQYVGEGIIVIIPIFIFILCFID
ncbi:MAG: SLATT domain-containing protein [Ruminococcus sp.]